MEEEPYSPKSKQGEDKKIIVITSVAVAALVLGFLGYYFFFNQESNQDVQDVESSISSCVILPEEYCSKGVEVELDASGTEGYAFNVPAGTPIYMPFDGTYFNESPEGEYVKIRIEAHSPVFLIVDYSPEFNSGDSALRGEKLAKVVKTKDFDPEEGEFNLVMYAEEYSLDEFLSILGDPSSLHDSSVSESFSGIVCPNFFSLDEVTQGQYDEKIIEFLNNSQPGEFIDNDALEVLVPLCYTDI